VTTRGRVVATSLVGSVGVAALGFVLFQSRPMSAEDLSARAPVVLSSSGPVTPPEASAVGARREIPPSASESATTTPAATRSSALAAGSAVSAGRPTPPLARAPESTGARGAENPTPAPLLDVPAIPRLTQREIAGHIDAPAASLGVDPLLTLPALAAPADRIIDPLAPPASVPFTQAPRVSNAERVQRALEREYPIGLRALGVGGRVELSFYINERGEVEAFETAESSGNADLDRAALRVAQVFEFTPALRGTEPVSVWYSLGINFGGGAGTLGPARGASGGALPPASAAGSSNQPVAGVF
jgi:TonB family protein